MKKPVAIAVAIALMCAPAFSANVSVMLIVGNGVHEDITFAFGREISGRFSYALPMGTKNVRVAPGTFTINGSTIIISAKNADKIKISFDTDGIVFKNGNVYQMFTTFNFGNSSAEIDAYLPSGYEIISTFPAATYSSDGRNIIAKWRINGTSDISMKYVKSSGETNAIPLIVVAAIAASAAIYYAISTSKKRLLGMLDEDERKVAELISSKRIIYQNKIERKLGLSRAKMTRIVKRLEKKGLVEKEKRGRTNKLVWKG